jgi:hypothetical protein
MAWAFQTDPLLARVVYSKITFSSLPRSPNVLVRTGRAILPTLRYLMQTEVHVYAFSVSAGMLLSFFPFLTLMLSLCHYVFKWKAGVNAVYFALDDYFPDTFGQFIRRNFEVTVASRGPSQLVSLLLLFFTASGIFEPLEVALNKIWRCSKNRNYFKNQLVSLGLIFACGALILISTIFTALNNQFLAGVAGRQAPTEANLLGLIFFRLAAIPISNRASGPEGSRAQFWQRTTRFIGNTSGRKSDRVTDAPRSLPEIIRPASDWRPLVRQKNGLFPLRATRSCRRRG